MDVVLVVFHIYFCIINKIFIKYKLSFILFIMDVVLVVFAKVTELCNENGHFHFTLTQNWIKIYKYFLILLSFINISF